MYARHQAHNVNYYALYSKGIRKVTGVGEGGGEWRKIFMQGKGEQNSCK